MSSRLSSIQIEIDDTSSPAPSPLSPSSSPPPLSLPRNPSSKPSPNRPPRSKWESHPQMEEHTIGDADPSSELLSSEFCGADQKNLSLIPSPPPPPRKARNIQRSFEIERDDMIQSVTVDVGDLDNHEIEGEGEGEGEGWEDESAYYEGERDWEEGGEEQEWEEGGGEGDGDGDGERKVWEEESEGGDGEEMVDFEDISHIPISDLSSCTSYSSLSSYSSRSSRSSLSSRSSIAASRNSRPSTSRPSTNSRSSRNSQSSPPPTDPPSSSSDPLSSFASLSSPTSILSTLPSESFLPGFSLSHPPTFASSSPPYPIFGVTLRLLMEYQGKGYIPEVVEKCIRFLWDRLETEGIFRLGGSKAKLDELLHSFNTKSNVNLESVTNDPILVSQLLKTFFRMLPEPIMTYELYDRFVETQNISIEGKRLRSLRSLCDTLPDENHALLETFFLFLHRVCSFSDKNLMNFSNIAIIFAPSFLKSKNETPQTILRDQVSVQNVLVDILKHPDEMFGILTCGDISEMYDMEEDLGEWRREEVVFEELCLATEKERERERWER